MKRAGFAMLLLSVVLLGFAATRASSYQTYDPAATGGNPNDGCWQCHPAFEARGPLHDVHVGSQAITSNCGLCHVQNGDNPILNKSAVDAAHGCNGCHVGPGLRKHHLTTAGVPVDGAGRRCNNAGCHPSDPTPVGENVAPLFYARTDVRVHSPCLSDKAAGGEHWDGDLVDLRGLDNDGDGLYEAADPNCSTAGVPGTTPSEFELAPPYPNPARSRVMFDLAIPRAMVVRVVVYDQAGRAVRTIADREFEPGRHSLDWDTRDDRGNPVASGVYFVISRAADMAARRTMVFIR